MKILQVTCYESPGKRFNGLSLAPYLKKRGIESQHLIWEKDTDNPSVLSFEGKRRHQYNFIANNIEKKLSIQSILYPNGWKMRRMPAFKEADLVHLHIIHTGFISLYSLPGISRSKPTVWTLHDPWALTGHCIHPFDCERWKTGCGHCPDLNSPMSLQRDNTRFLFKNKQLIYKLSKLDIIVGSRWMQKMVEQSPLLKNARIHLVPFGIDLNFFNKHAAPNARKKFDISPDSIVICFRAKHDEFKGLEYVSKSLEQLSTKHNVTLLTLNDDGFVKEKFGKKYNVIDLPWTNDETLLRDAMVAADIFLMPSLAESFGMMAIEALACEKPVIVFDGTALPEVTFAPEIGVLVPLKNVEALTKALQTLIDNPEERLRRGRLGRSIAEKHYSIEQQAAHLETIYQDASLCR